MHMLPSRDRTLRVGLCLLNLAAAGELAWILNSAVSSRATAPNSSTNPSTRPALGVFIAVVAVLTVLGLFFAAVAFRPPSRQQVFTTTADTVFFVAAASSVFAATNLYSSTSVLASVMATIPSVIGCVVCITQRIAVQRALALREVGEQRTGPADTFLVYCVPDQPMLRDQ